MRDRPHKLMAILSALIGVFLILLVLRYAIAGLFD